MLTFSRSALLLALGVAIAVAVGIVLLVRRWRLRHAALAARIDTAGSAISDAVLWCDRAFQVETWNGKAAETFGAPLRPGVAVGDLVDASSQQSVRRALERFATGRTQRLAIGSADAIRPLDESRSEARIELTVLRVGDDNRGGYLVVARSANESPEMEADRKYADRLDAAGQLAHGIAHEFTNLLTTITGRAEMALRQVRAGAPGHADLQEIRLASGRAAVLARRLRALSRHEALQPRIVDTNAVVRELEPTLRQLAGSAIVTFELMPDTGRVNADPARLHEVLLAIAQQSLDVARPAGGHVVVRTRRSHEPLRLRSSATDAPADFTVVEVVDNAQSSPEERGLQLAPAYAFARQGGGTLQLHAPGGRGTTVRLLLPRVPDDADAPRAGRLISPDLTRHPTVLVVEDEESVRLFIRVVLEKHGYRVLQAANGVEALRLLDDPRVAVDALLTDVMMPQMGGRELAERMLSVQPDVRVIFMSGYVADRVHFTGVAERNAPLLQKPFSLDELVNVVRDAIGEVGAPP